MTKLWGANGPSAFDVAQGSAGTCYFLASLGSVAEQNDGDGRDTIEKLIVLPDEGPGPTEEGSASHKAYGVLFCLQGGWTFVVTDNQLAIRDGDIAYCKTNGGVLWPALMEKAWCIAAGGGYMKNVEGGLPLVALHCLTGCPGNNYGCSDASENELWEAMQEAVAIT